MMRCVTIRNKQNTQKRNKKKTRLVTTNKQATKARTIYQAKERKEKTKRQHIDNRQTMSRQRIDNGQSTDSQWIDNEKTIHKQLIDNVQTMYRQRQTMTRQSTDRDQTIKASNGQSHQRTTPRQPIDNQKTIRGQSPHRQYAPKSHPKYNHQTV